MYYFIIYTSTYERICVRQMELKWYNYTNLLASECRLLTVMCGWSNNLMIANAFDNINTNVLYIVNITVIFNPVLNFRLKLKCCPKSFLIVSLSLPLHFLPFRQSQCFFPALYFIMSIRGFPILRRRTTFYIFQIVAWLCIFLYITLWLMIVWIYGWFAISQTHMNANAYACTYEPHTHEHTHTYKFTHTCKENTQTYSHKKSELRRIFLPKCV